MILLLSQEIKILLMSVIYKQGEQRKPGLQGAAVQCLGRAREEAMGRYQLLCLACKVTRSDRASFHLSWKTNSLSGLFIMKNKEAIVAQS